MHKVIEGLTAVEVIADDFLVVGYGQDLEAAIVDHDRHLAQFLMRCQENNLTINKEKLQLRKTELLFILPPTKTCWQTL